MNNCLLQFESFIDQIKKIDLSDMFSENITNPEFAVLKIIHDKSSKRGTDSVWVSEIVDEVQVTAQAVSKCLRGLEGKGYIERFVNKDDRRVIGVRLLPDGSEVLKITCAEIIEFMEKIKSEFEEAEYREFIRLSVKFENLFIENMKLAIKQKQMNGGQ